MFVDLLLSGFLLLARSFTKKPALTCVCAALPAAILVTYRIEKPCARLIKRKYGSAQDALSRQ